MAGIATPSGIQFSQSPNGKIYISLNYHRGSGNVFHKNSWHPNINPDLEFGIFCDSDRFNWFCFKGHYWGILEHGNKELGKNGERICKFPKPVNSNDPWHGYPIETKDHAIDENLISLWIKNKIITRTTARRIRRRLL